MCIIIAVMLGPQIELAAREEQGLLEVALDHPAVGRRGPGRLLVLLCIVTIITSIMIIFSSSTTTITIITTIMIIK